MIHLELSFYQPVQQYFQHQENERSLKTILSMLIIKEKLPF